ncbi:MAG TPA: glycosyltransferase family 39 protein [Acidobacteriota bacterium]|nr:glycosyltransferase family 39 protein [Acidobacteriota bacterium]
MVKQHRSAVMRNSVVLTDRPLFHAAVLLALSLVYFINLGTSSIWDASEAFYAGTAREMIASGDFVSPHFNYQPRTEKPPLTYWAIVVSYKIFGINEFAVRFPGALAAVGILLFTYAAARLLFGPRAALLAAAVIATTARVFIMERRLPIDILLLFFLTGTLYFFIRGIRKREKWCWLLAYVFLGLGFMTKGPVAVIIPAAVLGIWMLWTRKLKVSETHPLIGAVIFAGIVLPWYVLIYNAHGWAYIAPFFLSDNLGRFAIESMGPARGPLYYVYVFAADFFPWSLLTPLCVFWLWRNRRAVGPLGSSPFGILLLWCFFIFVLFSLSKNKQEYYIAPIYPAAAIIIAGIVERGLFRKISARSNEYKQEFASEAADAPIGGDFRSEDLVPGWKWTLYIIALLLFVLFLFAPFILVRLFTDVSFMLHCIVAAVLMACAAFMGWKVFRANYAGSICVCAMSLWIAFIAGTAIYVPALEAIRPVRDFCALIESRLQNGTADEAGYFRAALPSMSFYLRRPIFEEIDFDRMKERFRSDRRIFCIISETDYEHLVDENLTLHILDRRRRFSLRIGDVFKKEVLPGKMMLLVSNRPDSAVSDDNDK